MLKPPNSKPAANPFENQHEKGMASSAVGDTAGRQENVQSMATP